MTAKRMTQEQKVLQYMSSHEYITNREAFYLGVQRLSARIFNLRKAGHLIHTNMKTVHNKDGSTSNVAYYYLVKAGETND